MKNNTALIILIIILTIGITGFGVRSYYKSAERSLIEAYETDINTNNAIISDLHKQAADLLKQISRDSVMIMEKNAEIARLKGQYLQIKVELGKAKDQIKDFTAGQATQFFIDYSGAKDSRMLVELPDTSLIITTPSLRLVDDIFVEHKFQKEQIVNLNRTVTAQTNLIGVHITSINNYKELVANKNTEIDLMKENANSNSKQTQLKLDKLKSQRNRARWTVAGVATVVIVPSIISVFK